MSTQRPLTEDEKNELKALSSVISSALKARSAWLDAKMHEVSHLKIGDDIYDVNDGFKLGTITKLRRMQSGNHDGIYDSLDFYYEYKSSISGYTEHTAKKPGVGTLQDAIDRADSNASYLRRQAQKNG